MDTIEQIVEHAAEVLQTGIRQDCNLPEFDGMAEFRRVITTALQAQSEKGRQWNQLLELQLTNLQSLYTELNAAVVGYLEMRVSYEELLPHLTLKGEEESPAETGKTRNAALTAHDEALPFKPCPRCGADGDTHCGCYSEHDEALPGEWTEDTVFKLTRHDCSEVGAINVKAAHNSALRLLVDAQKDAICWLTGEHVSDNLHRLGALGSGDVRNALATLRKALQPYSGQKDGANGN